MYRGWMQKDYQNKHYNINQKDEGTLDDRGRDGGTNFILRIKEQETHLTLQEHDDDDDDEIIDSLNSHSINPRTVTVCMDSRVSLDLLHNPNNHEHLVEEIRKKVISMVRDKWKIKFSWVKAHEGIFGNEMGDSLAKEAARSKDTNYVFSRIPISAIYREAAEEAILKWQEQWKKDLQSRGKKTVFPNSNGQNRDKN